MQEPALTALRNVLPSPPYNLPFNQALQEFYTWCFFTDYRANEDLYFEEGSEYPALKFDRPPILQENTSVSSTAEVLSAKYFSFLRDAQNLQGRLQIAVDPGRFGLTLFTPEANAAYQARTAYGLAPVFSEAQARQDTVVFLVVNSSLVEGDYALQIILGDQIQLENQLDPPFPNPFRPQAAGIVTVPYRINQTAVVEAAIFSEDGRKVWNQKPERKALGSGTLEWNGRDDEGRLVPSGVYIMRFWTNAFAATTKIVVINR